MPPITGIVCGIGTGDVDGAGTDGRVYLGLGGREFRLDSTADDYERGSRRDYIMGRGPNDPPQPPEIQVVNGEQNDPRVGFALATTDLYKNPVYIRFEPAGSSPDWNLHIAVVLVYVGEGQRETAFSPPFRFQNLWLGDRYGKILFMSESRS